MVFQSFIPNVFATKKNNRGHLDLLLHGIFNLKKCHWFINNDLFGNDNCHIGDNKKIAAGKQHCFWGCHYWRVFGRVWVVCASLVCCFWSFWVQKPANTLPHIQQRCFTQNILFVSCIWKPNSITLAQLPQTSRMWKTQILHYMLCAYLPKGQYGQPHYWMQPRAYCSLHLPRTLT